MTEYASPFLFDLKIYLPLLTVNNLAPHAIHFLGLDFSWFGILAMLGLAVSTLVTGLEMKRKKLSPGILPDLAFAVILGGFIVARISYIFSNLDYYSDEPLAIFKLWEGGLIQYGGIVGGMLGGFIFCKQKNLSFRKLADCVALSLPVGFAIGRLGCLMAGCCYGRPAFCLWGIAFHNPLAVARPLDTPLYPTQIYAVFAEVLIFIFLLAMRDRKTFDGQLLVIYLMLASASRFVINLFRADLNVLSMLQVLTVFVFSVCIYVYFKINQRRKVNMKPILKLTALFLVVSLFAACGIVTTQKLIRGHNISKGSVNKIEKGMTTERQILGLFGPPNKVRDTDQGKEYLYEYTRVGGFQWNLLFSIGGGTATKTLLVWFNKEGVVTDYAYKSS